MRKKILAVVAAVAVAAVAVINMDLVSGKQEDGLSALHLANIEALADGESGDGKGNCSRHCKHDRNYICITPYGLIEDYMCAD